jgi:hypothetical protein
MYALSIDYRVCYQLSQQYQSIFFLSYVACILYDFVFFFLSLFFMCCLVVSVRLWSADSLFVVKVIGEMWKVRKMQTNQFKQQARKLNK